VGILRIPVLLGPLEKIGESSVTVLAKLVFPRVKVGETVDDSFARSSAHVREVANVCVGLAEIRVETATDTQAIWHLPSSPPFTDWEITQMISKILKIDVQRGEGGLSVAGASKVAISLDGSTLQDLFATHGKAHVLQRAATLEEDLNAILTALIPSAALKQHPIDPLAAAANASGIKTGLPAAAMPTAADGKIWLDRGDGKMIQTTQAAGALLQEANTLIATGNMDAGMAKMKEAMALDPSLAVMDEESDKKCIMMVTQMIMSGNIEMAEMILCKYYEKKCTTCPLDSWSMMQIVEAFVFLYKHKEGWDDMVFWASKATALVKAHKGERSTEMATSLSNFGLACGPLGRSEEAEEAFMKALSIHESLNGPTCLQVGQTCHNIALLFRNTQKMDKAEEYYERSRKVWVLEEQWALLAVSYKDSAIMYRNAAKFDLCFQMLDQAVATTKKITNFPPEQVEAQLQLQPFRKDCEERRKNAAT